MWEGSSSSTDSVAEKQMVEMGTAQQLQNLVDAQAAALTQLGIRCVADPGGAYPIESEHGSPVASLQSRVQELVADQKRTTAYLNELTRARADQDVLMQICRANSASVSALLLEVLRESKDYNSLLKNAEQDAPCRMLQEQGLENGISAQEKYYRDLVARTKDLWEQNQMLAAQIHDYKQTILDYEANTNILEEHIRKLEESIKDSEAQVCDCGQAHAHDK
jgi:chromosome segregation ATPase